MFWQKKPDTQDILARIGHIIPRDSKVDVVIQNGQVVLSITVNPQMPRDDMAQLQAQAKRIVENIKYVKSAQIILTAEKTPQPDNAANEKQAGTHAAVSRPVAPFVKQIIAVASGKGGVGKSTVAANLAVALAKQGLRVGLLDADIYGPSVPTLLGVRHSKPAQENEYLIPVEAHGIKIMSMGFMVDEEAPMVWRGPMVQSALLQMLRDVRWGTAEEPLDVLVLDMPPGTGDTQLTIAQKVKLAGAVIVSTPQDIALLDTVKGVNMFQKVAVPVLGIIENMSFFCCPECGHHAAIFGQGGARKRAEELNIRFLGDIPLDMALRETSDKGIPAAAKADHPLSAIFSGLASQIFDLLKENTQQAKPAPKIIIEDEIAS